MIIAPPKDLADVPRWKKEFIALYDELGYGEVTEDQLPDDEYFEQMFAESEDQTTKSAANCGTGAGGFQPGNDCASGDGSGAATPRKVNDLARRIREDGGFTYNPVTDSSPTKGFAVSPFKELETVIETQAPEGMDIAKYRKNIRPKLKKYIKDNIKTLRRKGAHLGGWWDKEAKKVYLDISIVSKNLKDAMKIAKQHDQEAIFDLEKMETISAR